MTINIIVVVVRRRRARGDSLTFPASFGWAQFSRPMDDAQDGQIVKLKSIFPACARVKMRHITQHRNEQNAAGPAEKWPPAICNWTGSVPPLTPSLRRELFMLPDATSDTRVSMKMCYYIYATHNILCTILLGCCCCWTASPL